MTFNYGVTIIYTGVVQTYGAYQSQLTTVILPASLTTIQANAFENCAALTLVVFNGDNLTTIGPNAFKSCSSLPTISLPDTVITIGDYTFQYCTSLYTLLPINRLPSQLVIMGEGVFANTGLLTEPLFPPGITAIPANTFYQSAITGLVNIPQLGEAIETIGDGAFQGCGNITSIRIGSQITSIGDKTSTGQGAFQSCTGIVGGIYIPSSVTLIGNDTFKGDIAITDVSLNNGLTWIGNSAFAGCTGINNVFVIPPTVTYVDALALYNCILLTGITYTSSTTINSTAFLNSTTNITVIPAIEPPSGLYGTPSTISIYLHWTPPTNTGGLPIQSYTITDTVNHTTYTAYDTSYNITNLLFNVPYTYTMTSYNGVSTSPPSDPVTITTLNKTPVTFTFDPGHLTQIYTGASAIPADISCNPAVDTIFFNPPVYFNNSYSSNTPPTNAGNYTVDVSLNNSNPTYYGSGSSPFVIQKAPASFIIGGTTQPFTGNPVYLTVTTNPIGLNYSAVYTPIPPTTDITHTQVGTYSVQLTIVDQNYYGSSNTQLTIISVLPTIVFYNITQTYTGSPLAITATTVPVAYNVDVSYNGVATPPTIPGIYSVTAHINDPAWIGQDISGRTLFTILKEPVTFSFTNLAQPYTGAECIPVGITTVPASSYIVGPTYLNIYNEILQSPPNVPGTYTVLARIDVTDPLYTGSGSARLIIAQPIIQTNCSPALELNALSHGGTFASGITDMIQAQAIRTDTLLQASRARGNPIQSPGPNISRYAGGIRSSALIQNQIAAAEICATQQNLAIYKLRLAAQPTPCPVDPNLRFAQYNRPAPPAACPTYPINPALPAAINGPCTNVVGINTTWPP
jgi:BspA type Leucine rich repeat region (6 copies)/MBG domain/Fibronectin type III domain